MAPTSWSSKMKVGVSVIGDDHHKLYEAVDEIEVAVKMHEPREVVGQLLRKCVWGGR
jgi:hemerythrin